MPCTSSNQWNVKLHNCEAEQASPELVHPVKSDFSPFILSQTLPTIAKIQSIWADKSLQDQTEQVYTVCVIPPASLGLVSTL